MGHHTKVYRLTREQLHLIKQSFEGQSFPILTNRSRVWLVNHLYHHVVFTDCERQDKIFVMAEKIVHLRGPSKSIRYSEVCFPIFYCNSAGLSNIVRCNGVFVIARFVIAGCHCTLLSQCLSPPRCINGYRRI